MWRLWSWIALFTFVLVAQPARAEVGEKERDAARALAESALDRYAAGDYAEALERFRAAERIVHAPPHLLYMARCLANLGRLVEARDVYRKLETDQPAADAPPAFREAWSKAPQERAAVEQRLAELRVEVRGPPPEQVQLTVDDRAVSIAKPIALDPGSHRIVARATGHRETVRQIALGEGAQETVTLSLEPAQPTEPSRAPAGDSGVSIGWPVAVIVLGGAGLIVGAITGGLALAKKNELETACPDKLACPAENKTLEDEGRALGTASTVAFVAGGAIAAAGIIWLAVALSSDDAPNEKATVLPYARDSLAGFTVRF